MRSIIVGSVAAAIVLAAAGCASPGADAPTAPGSPASLADLPAPSPAGEVLTIATVLEQGAGAILCVGPVAESAPPQCGGPELLGWDWDAFAHQETGGVRWVQGVAITGVYEAAADAFTQTGEPMSAAAITLPAIEVPSGELDDATIEAMQRELGELGRADFFGIWSERGTMVLEVFYDDGSLQGALDEIYGSGAVFVISALRDTGGSAGDAPELVDPPMDTAAPVITGADAQARLAELPTPLPAGGVWAGGLAMDRPEGDVLCLGDVGASAPPVCTGVPLRGFDWTALTLDEAQGIRWVDALVFGTWDGEVFAMTSPPQPFDAWSPPAVEVSEVSLPEAVLMGIQSDLLTLDRHDILSHGPTDGHYELHVLFDDGSIQADLDAIYGAGVVQIFSAMQG
ncbi:hypothetical protein SAMN04487783_2158 [Agrococcus baldri]|uniref:Lipoprotein n=1 Tax=Agrococcus baldri TaxID=153730 RepID=A0AA94HNV6_9MICO|nr:hypothetical protein [Agrococcus baldri]SFS15904.1 hypothetical protein SAMN04487783_2158 [Agrococcus baldri]